VNHNISARLELFPITTSIQSLNDQPVLTIAGLDLPTLADQYGTSLYIYDRYTLDANLKAYRQALAAHYPGPSAITYAGKAFLCLAMAQWAESQDLYIDCSSAGEVHICEVAGVKRTHLVVHGVNKSQEDIQAALSQAGTIIVDNLTELQRIADLYSSLNPNNSNPHELSLLLRFRPGVTVDTHAYTQTGQIDSKFGMRAEQVLEAIYFCHLHRLPLIGLHFHLGSHFHDPPLLGPAIEAVLNLINVSREQCGWTPQVFSPGGGWGVSYHEDDLPQPSIDKYVAFLAQEVIAGCQQRGFSLPRLQLEPGRSLVARAGVAVYRVGTVKYTANRRWLLLDGGLADNPRPALYKARYSALPIVEPLRSTIKPTWIAGPYCESGDILIEGLPMPEVRAGELIAIPVSGAYQLSMGSNYNGARRPAVLWLDHSGAHLIQERESLQDLTRRDRKLPI
jgi:diaminopimelate decarboxylase